MKTLHVGLMLGLWAKVVLSADVVFDSAEICSGQPLYGNGDISPVACFDISDFEPARSALVSNVAATETLNLFADSQCQELIHSIDGSLERSCYSAGAPIGSFQLLSTARHDDAAFDVVERGVAISDVKLANYTELNLSSMEVADIRYGNLLTGVHAKVIKNAIAFGLFIESCYSAITSHAVVPIIACIASPVSVVLSIYADFFYEKGTEETGHDLRESYNMNTGQHTNIKRSIDETNSVYMAAVMNGTDSNGFPLGTHVGHMARDLGTLEQTSPIYEVDMGDKGKWHLSAFYDEVNGGFIHHIHSAEDTAKELAKRKAPVGFNTLRIKEGGIDARFCYYNKAAKPTGYKGVPRDKKYNIFYDQLTCQTTPAQLKKAGAIQVDFHNEQSHLLGIAHLKPYYHQQVSPPACGGPSIPLNQDCFGP